MKRFLKILILLFFAGAGQHAYSQGSASAIDDVVNAFRAGRVENLERYIDKYLSVEINNNVGNYSHNQARQVLKDFLTKNPPIELNVNNNVSSNEMSRFAICTYTSPKGKYQLYIQVQRVDRIYVLKEVRFDKE